MNDTLKSIIEEFDKNGWQVMCRDENDVLMVDYDSVKAFFLSKLTDYGALEREEGAKEERQKNIDTAFSVANATHEVILEKEIAEARAAGREEAIREILEMLNREFDDLEKLGLQSLSGEVVRMRINLLSLQKTSQEEK